MNISKLALLNISLSILSLTVQARRLGEAEHYPNNNIIRRNLAMDPNSNNCQSTIDNGGSGCGGDGSDLWNEGSCTPYPFRAAKGSQSQATDFCNSDSVQNFAGADQKSGNDASDSFAVWYDDSQADDDPNKNYWIIHGCDGSGVQTGDCGGGTGYIEQIGKYSPTYADSNNGGWNGDVVNIENDTGDDNMNEHVITVFQHPGTNKVYDWMWAGMWTPGGNDWPEEEKPWWNNQGIQDTSQLGPDDSIFFSLYPWVCMLGDQDLSWYQNAGGAGKQLDPIYGTDCDTGGKCNDYSKCFYDNEPYSNNHDDSTSIPPRARHYKFANNGDGTLTGWMLYEKTYEGGGETQNYTTKCNSCDDNCKNNGDCFILQRLDNIPW